MLGEKVGEVQGKMGSRRVLKGDAAGSYNVLEISIEEQGTILGVQGMSLGTYTMYERGPGQLYGEGQGVIQGMDGSNAIWNGHGVGRDAGNGAMTFAASIAVQTDSEPWKRLNGVLVLVEHSANMMDGSTKSVMFEWKA